MVDSASAARRAANLMRGTVADGICEVKRWNDRQVLFWEMTVMVIWRWGVMTWAATQAKAKFSEVLDRAETEGPQVVRRRKHEFVVITREQFDALPKSTMGAETAKERQSLVEFFRNSPAYGLNANFKRVKLRRPKVKL